MTDRDHMNSSPSGYSQDEFLGEKPLCNLVLQGGVTSGVVYPLAIAEVAKGYKFAKVAGASAGAIAASIAAAAEFNRQGGGFVKIAQIAHVRASRPCVIYYYAPHERTFWRKLRAQYPAVVAEEEIEAMFEPDSAVDLYTHVVRSKTEWPTRDYSLKTLASFLGFKWRDTHPSGAASIEWCHRWTEGGDAEVRQRILDYNEDDCVATRVLVDGIRELQVLE